MNDLKLIKTYEWLETYKSLWMIINYDYKNLRENLFNLKRFFENLGKLIKIKSRSCIENLFNFIFSGWCEKLLLSSFLWEFVRRIIMIKCQQEVKKLGFHFRLFNEVVWMCLWLGWDIIHTAVNYMFLVEK